MIALNWTNSLSLEMKEAVFAALLHSCSEIEYTTNVEAAGTQLKNLLDPALNDTSAFQTIPPGFRRPIWASLVAYLDDIHAPQDNLSKEEWEAADALLRHLNLVDTDWQKRRAGQ